MFRPSVLILALLVSGQSLWKGLVSHQMPMMNALIWFLAAYVAAAIVMWALRSLMAGYSQADQAKKAAKRSTERPN